MAQRERLHGSLTTVEYFTFGFGTMIGVGWLVLMDDWLTRGGPLGGILGYLLGGLLLFPIAHTYGRLVQRVQDARHVRDLHVPRLRARLERKHAAALRAESQSVARHFSRAADRSVLHDRLRIGRERIRGSESRLRPAQLRQGDLRGARRGIS